MQRVYHWPYPITQLKLAKKIKEESLVQNMQGSTTYFELKRWRDTSSKLTLNPLVLMLKWPVFQQIMQIIPFLCYFEIQSNAMGNSWSSLPSDDRDVLGKTKQSVSRRHCQEFIFWCSQFFLANFCSQLVALSSLY